MNTNGDYQMHTANTRTDTNQDQISFSDEQGNRLVFKRVFRGSPNTGQDVYIEARNYRQSTDNTQVFENVSGRAMWSMLHDFLA